jgi:hypothetical protein
MPERNSTSDKYYPNDLISLTIRDIAYLYKFPVGEEFRLKQGLKDFMSMSPDVKREIFENRGKEFNNNPPDELEWLFMARDLFIYGYLPLALDTASKSHVPLGLEEKISVAYEALVRASDRYNPKLGVKFTTYVVECIKDEIKTEGEKCSTNGIHIPRALYQKHLKNIRSTFPINSQETEELNILLNPLSLDDSTIDEDLDERIPDTNQSTVNEVEKRILEQIIDRIFDMQKLPLAYAMIKVLYDFVDLGKSVRIKDLPGLTGYTEKECKKIIADALSELREFAEIEKLGDFLTP